MKYQILQGDALTTLKTLADESVQMCVTSPPYWGLRDYGIEGQAGLESNPDDYVKGMVGVFREVKRVLKDAGTLWLNLGDSYATQPGKGNNVPQTKWKANTYPEAAGHRSLAFPGLKPKDLVGIPWRVAFALQADGWYLRSDIIWHKPNPMPESVTDRPTKSHEYLFLLTKSEKYYYDIDAIREPHVTGARPDKWEGRTYNGKGPNDGGADGRRNGNARAYNLNPLGRNKRSVWTIPTRPYKGAHFATFPPALVEPCVLAGSRPAGKRCDCGEVIATPLGSGAVDDPSLVTGRSGFNRPRRSDEGTRPITRREQRAYAQQMKESPFKTDMAEAAGSAFAHYIRTDRSGARPLPPELLAKWLDCGWLVAPPPCDCPTMPADIVLDPFCGSGTTGAVALQHNREFLGIELNPAYIELAHTRISGAATKRAA